MSLLFNILTRFLIAFLPRGKHLLISWLQTSSAVILESKKMKSAAISIFSPSICQEIQHVSSLMVLITEAIVEKGVQGRN